jgi:hypothetical protein
MAKVASEAQRTGRGALELFNEFAAGELTEEDVHVLKEFKRSALGQKVGRLTPQVYKEWDA